MAEIHDAALKSTALHNSQNVTTPVHEEWIHPIERSLYCIRTQVWDNKHNNIHILRMDTNHFGEPQCQEPPLYAPSDAHMPEQQCALEKYLRENTDVFRTNQLNKPPFHWSKHDTLIIPSVWVTHPLNNSTNRSPAPIFAYWNTNDGNWEKGFACARQSQWGAPVYSIGICLGWLQ